eukprot:gene12723-29728_t
MDGTLYLTRALDGWGSESTTDDGYIQAPPTIDYSRKVLFAAEGETAHEIDHEEQDVGRGSAPSSVLGYIATESSTARRANDKNNTAYNAHRNKFKSTPAIIDYAHAHSADVPFSPTATTAAASSQYETDSAPTVTALHRVGEMQGIVDKARARRTRRRRCIVGGSCVLAFILAAGIGLGFGISPAPQSPADKAITILQEEDVAMARQTSIGSGGGATLSLQGESLIWGVEVLAHVVVTYYNKTAQITADMYPAAPLEALDTLFGEGRTHGGGGSNSAATIPRHNDNMAPGLNFVAVVNLTHTPGIAAAAKVLPGVGVSLDVSGQLLPRFSLVARLPQPMTIAAGVTVTSFEFKTAVTAATPAEPADSGSVTPRTRWNWNVTADIQASIPGATFDLKCIAALPADPSDDFKLVAYSENKWHFDIGGGGSSEVGIDATDVSLVVQAATRTSAGSAGGRQALPMAASLKGMLRFDDFDLNMVPKGSTVDTSAIPADILSRVYLKNTLLYARILITVGSMQSTSVAITGRMALFSDTALLDVDVVLKRAKESKWHVAVGVDVGNTALLTSIVPGEAKTLDRYSFSDIMLLITTFDTPQSFAFMPRAIEAAGPGVKWTGIDAVEVACSFQTATETLTFEADLVGTNWAVGPVKMTKVSVLLEVAMEAAEEAANPKLSLDGFFDLRLRGQTLQFVGGVSISPIEATLYAAMTSDWAEPLGLRGLTLTKCALQVGFNLETGLPMSIGVMGGMVLGSAEAHGSRHLHGNATVLVDAADPESTVLSVDVANFDLTTLIQDMCTGCTVPAILEQTILDVSFKEAFLQVNPGSVSQTFNGEVYQPGAVFRLTDVHLFGLLAGSADIRLAGTAGDPAGADNAGASASLLAVPSSIVLNLTINATTLFGVVGIASADGHGPFVINGHVERDSSGGDDVSSGGGSAAVIKSASLFADCSITLLELFTARATLDIDDNHFAASIEYDYADSLLKLHVSVSISDFDVLDFVRGNPSIPANDSSNGDGSGNNGDAAAGVGGFTSDFELRARFENEFLDYLGHNVTGSLKVLVSSFDRRLVDARAAVADWETTQKPKIAGNNEKIAAEKNKDEKNIDEGVAAVQVADSAVRDAQHHVDSLSDEIKSIHSNIQHCTHWYSVSCHADNAWRDSKIAGLETAKLAADAALLTAQGILEGAKAALKESGKVVPDVDPAVLAWEAENTAITTAGKVAKATLGGVQGLVDGAAAAAEWILKETSDLFNVESLFISAESLQNVVKDEAGIQCTFEAGGVFAGHRKNWSGTFFFPPSPTSVFDDVMRIIKQEIQGKVSNMVGGW